MTTREGFALNTATQDLQKGLQCAAVISPSQSPALRQSQSYDVIVIGAGYAGLTACRDLCVAGMLIVRHSCDDK